MAAHTKLASALRCFGLLICVALLQKERRATTVSTLAYSWSKHMLLTLSSCSSNGWPSGQRGPSWIDLRHVGVPLCILDIHLYAAGPCRSTTQCIRRLEVFLVVFTPAYHICTINFHAENIYFYVYRQVMHLCRKTSQNSCQFVITVLKQTNMLSLLLLLLLQLPFKLLFLSLILVLVLVLQLSWDFYFCFHPCCHWQNYACSKRRFIATT